MARACAVGLLLWACSSSPQQDEAGSYVCASPPADLAACSTDTDCATVALGCYCGAQPVNGVANKYATAAQTCETTAARMCALGCANEPGMVAQDGSKVNTSAMIAVHCDLASGAPGACKSYRAIVPGPSDPPPSGW